MAEQYPDDATLLAIDADPTTGVEYIPTGRSPYYLEFRKTLHRLLRAAERANDLRVYADGDLTVGVRAGRFVIGSNALELAATAGVTVPAASTTSIWIDASAALQTASTGFPVDRGTFLPLAVVTTDATSITAIDDRRGEAFLHSITPGVPGLTATVDEINRALDGIDPVVTANTLNVLAGGPTSLADNAHTHTRSVQMVAAEAEFLVTNVSADAAAGLRLALSLPSILPYDTHLAVDTTNGFLQQRYGPDVYALVGVHTLQATRAGDVTATETGGLLGAAPAAGSIVDAVLSLGTNLVTDQPADGLSLDIKVNGASALQTAASLTVADAAGRRSTAQGDGTPAAVLTNGSERVQRGDLLTFDLTRTVAGSLTQDAADAVVLVVIQSDGPN